MQKLTTLNFKLTTLKVVSFILSPVIRPDQNADYQDSFGPVFSSFLSGREF